MKYKPRWSSLALLRQLLNLHAIIADTLTRAARMVILPRQKLKIIS
jgi:hypothetical protein